MRGRERPMGFVNALRRSMGRAVRSFGYELIQRDLLYDWQRNWERTEKASRRETRLPDGAQEHLTLSNPRIRELEQQYARADLAVTVPAVWNRDCVSEEDL